LILLTIEFIKTFSVPSIFLKISANFPSLSAF